MKEEEKKKQELYILVYNQISNNMESELWAPYTRVKIYKDYYTALGHMVEEFNVSLESRRKQAYFNGKAAPTSEQRDGRYSIKHDTGYEEWKIEKETVE